MMKLSKHFGAVVLMFLVLNAGAAVAQTTPETPEPADTTSSTEPAKPPENGKSGDFDDPKETAEQIRRSVGSEEEDPGDGSDDDRLEGWEMVLRLAIGMGVVVALMYTAVYLLRKYVPSARNMFGAGGMKIVSRTYLGSRQCLLLVKVGSKFVMVGVTGTTMSTLTEISDSEQVRSLTAELATGSTPSIADSFKEVLKSREEEYASESYEVEDNESYTDGDQERELHDARKELDAVTGKMNWLRNKNNSG